MEREMSKRNAASSTPNVKGSDWLILRPASAPKQQTTSELITPLSAKEHAASKIPVITPKANKVVSRASNEWPGHGLRFNEVVNDTSLTPVNAFGRAATAGSTTTAATVGTKLNSNELREDDSVSCITNSSTSTPCNPKKRKLEAEPLPFFSYKRPEYGLQESSMLQKMRDPEMAAWINESLETIQDYEKIVEKVISLRNKFNKLLSPETEL
ncbi:hypothetical protein KL935_003812 [Ogataea polymorpha]|uniref:uncharacterized protein n=1 Tax=Ogataea polymorpha TaxID=460523 RepID=UPI0007F4DCFA|nr:uncharacterized protein OGAPODRAFT_10414 [Ogataea polymorpha]KAG7899502.1 hypothetical protein KL935_003812 [Ogataea polymorpha]KAG7932995.1 hypothetical protein KL934_003650 [Ogataea polymorpha]OBA13747.1 hypothetical protein OGAPODRAFT_10414 [Ogataea polymorpha]